MYDSIVGFAADAVNPFRDASRPADQIFVDELSCIGCGKCVRSAPATFAIEESQYGRARVINQRGDEVEAAVIAIETCPGM